MLTGGYSCHLFNYISKAYQIKETVFLNFGIKSNLDVVKFNGVFEHQVV